MAYIWSSADKMPDYLNGIIERKKVHDGTTNKLMVGEIIQDTCLVFEIERTKRKVIPEQFLKFNLLKTIIRIPLVDKQVLQILEQECAGKFQAIPSIIKLPEGEVVKDYFVINVTNKVPIASLEDCIRHKRFADEKNIRASIFYTVVYKNGIIEQEDLCRDSILNENLVFISDRLRGIFRKEKIKGGGFHESLSNRVVFV